MLKIDKAYKRQTGKIYKVPHSVQDTIPIYRISEDGIFEIENKKGIHLFDKVYLFEDINYSTQDESEKEQTIRQFKKLLNGMEVSYKIIISNHYADNKRLRETLLNKAVNKELEPLAKEYHKLVRNRLSEGREGLLQSRYFVLSCYRTDFKSARTYFNTIEFNIKSQFHQMGSTIIPLNATSRLRALHSFYRMGEEETFHFNWSEYLKLKRDWRNDIVNTCMKEHKDYIELEGNKVACTLFVRQYPSGLSDAFINELANVPFPLIITMDCEPMDNGYAYNLVMRKYMGNERSINKEQELKNENGDYSSNISYEKQIKQREGLEMLNNLHGSKERLFYVGITILIRADSMEELEERKEKIMIIGSSNGMDIVPHSYKQLDGLNTTLPTASRFLDTMRSLTTESLSIFTPFNVQEINEEHGYCYGYNKVSKNLILGNRKMLKNGNGMVFGVPGSGKSFQEKMEMGQVLCFSNDDIVVIDPMGEYRGIAEKWNGQYINLSQSAENIFSINPFHVPENLPDKEKFIAEKAEFAYAICEQAIKPNDLTSRHIAIIDRAVRSMYDNYFDVYKNTRVRKRKYIPCPTIRNLRDYIKTFEADNETAVELCDQLEVFTDGTLDIFAREQSTSESNRFTVYGFSELGKRMRAMAMLVMIESITSKIKYNQSSGIATWVYVDEIHELWGDEYSLHAIERMWREVRKRGGICTGMSQNLVDAISNRATKTIVSNSEFMMILDQGVMDREILSELFEVSSEQINCVNGANPGTGLIRFSDKIIPFSNEVDSDSKLYKLFNTNFHELNMN